VRIFLDTDVLVSAYTACGRCVSDAVREFQRLKLVRVLASWVLGAKLAPSWHLSLEPIAFD